MSIIIGGDFVPTASNYHLLQNQNMDELIGTELKKLFQNAEYRIFNLEVPLSDKEEPIDKGGHNMIAPTSVVNGFKGLGINLFTLCNNHILDQGYQGMRSTCASLHKAGISYMGVGENVLEAAKPFYIEAAGKKFGIYACAEHEFSIADENRPGANPFDPLETPDHIRALKENCEYVIVLYHGGKEHYPYPSPNLQKACRKLVEKGADLILCQHSHCIGCEEKYLGKTIVYGQGNFLFDMNSHECWNSGLLVQINSDLEIKYIPVVKAKNVVRLADEDLKNKILKDFWKRSNEIKQKGFVEEHYSSFAKNASGYYFLEFTGKRIPIFIFRVLNKLSKQRLRENFRLKNKYQGRHYMLMRNYIECEAHRELIVNALTEQGLDYND